MTTRLDEVSDRVRRRWLCVGGEQVGCRGSPTTLLIHANHAELIRAPLLFSDPAPVACMPYLLKWHRHPLRSDSGPSPRPITITTNRQGGGNRPGIRYSCAAALGGRSNGGRPVTLVEDLPAPYQNQVVPNDEYGQLGSDGGHRPAGASVRTLCCLVRQEMWEPLVPHPRMRGPFWSSTSRNTCTLKKPTPSPHTGTYTGSSST